MTTPTCPVLIVDGNNLLYRAAHGMGARAEVISKTSGRDITALVGFFSLLNRAIAEEVIEPCEVIVVFDSETGSAQRKSMDANYKGNRDVELTIADPFECLPEIKAGLELFNITWLQSDDAEADDVVATLVSRFAATRWVFILSSDKDFFQLISPRVAVLNTMRAPNERIVTADVVLAKYGVLPCQWVDFRALSGDPSDNIAGVKGVGPKTAAKILADQMRLEDLPASGRLDAPRPGNAIKAQWDQVLTWKQMITLRTDVELTELSRSGEPSQRLWTSEVLQHTGL